MIQALSETFIVFTFVNRDAELVTITLCKCITISRCYFLTILKFNFFSLQRYLHIPCKTTPNKAATWTASKLKTQQDQITENLKLIRVKSDNFDDVSGKPLVRIFFQQAFFLKLISFVFNLIIFILGCYTGMADGKRETHPKIRRYLFESWF